MVLRRLVASISVMTLVCVSVFADTDSIAVDLATAVGPLNHGSTGFLYGLGDPGIPAPQMLMALKPTTAAQKPPDGIQHPNGDAFKVSADFRRAGGREVQIYMQDCYRQWPYENLGLEDYLPRIDAMVRKSLDHPDRDLFVWVPLNEPDVIWYQGRIDAFCEDWQACYRAIRKADPKARIAGPNTTAYSEDFFSIFLSYAKKNRCLPDVITWHELQNDFFPKWNEHYRSYRKLESNLKISPIPITINEYGRFTGDLAMPGKLIQYISRFEESQVSGCLAYWTTAGSLNDLVTANTRPTGAWWLYKWYGEMTGNRVTVSGGAGDAEGLRALATLDQKKAQARIVFGGARGEISLAVSGARAILPGSPLASVHVALWTVGSSALNPSVGPVLLLDEDRPLLGGRLELSVENSDDNSAYLAILSPAGFQPAALPGKSSLRPSLQAADGRLEAEYADLSGTAAVSAGPSPSVVLDAASRIRFVVDAPKDGYYRFSLHYSGSGERALSLNQQPLAALPFKEGSLEQPLAIFLGAGINILDVEAPSKAPGHLLVDWASLVPSSGPLDVYEAEAATLSPKLSIKDEAAVPSGKVVSFDRAGPKFILTFTGVKAPAEGDYRLVVRYANGELGLGAQNYNTNIVDRQADITCNGALSGTLFFRNTLGWSSYSTAVATVHLKAGSNDVALAAKKGYAPLIDSIAIALPVAPLAPALALAPRLELGRIDSVVFPAPLNLSVRAAALPAGAGSWRMKAGPAPLSIASPGALSTRAQASVPGDYVVEFSAPGCLVSAAVTVYPEGTYEAEAGLRAGTAALNAVAAASGGKAVGYIGNGEGNTLTFPAVLAKKAGTARVQIRYITAEPRTALLSVNGERAVSVQFPSTGSWTAVSSIEVSLPLSSGANSLEISNPSGYAPDIDLIRVLP